MSEKPDNQEPVEQELPAESGASGCEEPDMLGASRKLRYDAPALDIPRPLYLRAKDDESDEEAA